MKEWSHCADISQYNSYNILAAGEQNVASGGVADVANTGWDFGSVTASENVTYQFSLAAASDFNLCLTWNAIYEPTAGDYNNMQLTLADLGVSLFDATSGTLIAFSDYATGNLEYLSIVGLSAGDYYFLVTSKDLAADYAVAWRSAVVSGVIPEPAMCVFILGIFGLLAVFIGRRSLRDGFAGRQQTQGAR
ncbi:pre-peptidase C-terminal domain-containing protein [Geminisphaera colitermitum]|uniref:pre-peptidase C-terminal domain-containing protein n=1 Tax=Geminisphaera colitermitum TaxID=1148786 RepID=UPI000158D162|nr:pre-peptidase C-terminal domain-containing protein [Geminisphaera colitermitum]